VGEVSRNPLQKKPRHETSVVAGRKAFVGQALAIILHFRPSWSGAVIKGRQGRLMTNEASLDRAMDRYAQGDESAFAALYQVLAPKLRSFLFRLSGRSPIADDLLQETFMRMHRARGSFESGAAVVPWAYAIARNAWLDHIRSARVRGRIMDRDGESNPAAEPATGPEADAEKAAIAHETAALVQKVLAGLPSTQREAFVLLRYEGMSVDQAAEILGSTSTAVKLRAFRAYEALRAALGTQRSASGGDHET
jgi:RNA polymerase sigma-70 factor (ECF subfamily)